MRLLRLRREAFLGRSVISRVPRMDAIDSIKNPVALTSSLRLQFWCSLGVTVLLVYDIIITMDDEVEYFWTSHFGSINLIFFVIRYSAVVRNIANTYLSTLTAQQFLCRTALWSASIIDWAIIACIDYILLLRVRALFSFETRYRSIVRGLQVLYVINALVGLSGLIASLLKTGAFIHVISETNNMRFCDYTSGKLQVSLRSLFWCAPLSYGSILLILALYKAASIRKSLGYRGLELVKVLIIDQAMYFLSIIVCSVANIVTNTGSLQNLPAVLFALQVIGGAELLSLLGSRMLIRLKQVANRRPEGEASFRLSSDSEVSEPEFRTYGVDENTRSVQYSWALGD